MLIFTTAGTEYDYGHTNEVARVIVQGQRDRTAREPVVLRVVDVVGENDDRTKYLTTYQADRYRSGLHFTTTDPDDAGVFLQLRGGPGITALLRGYAAVCRLCDECGDELDPTFDPPGCRCGSCREAADRSLRPDIPDGTCPDCGREDMGDGCTSDDCPSNQ